MQMNTKEKTKRIWDPVWPGPREARLRLGLITMLLVPLEWAIFALLVGDWKLNLTDGGEEPVRHLMEGTVILVAAVSVIFLASLLPAFGLVHRFLGWLFSARIARRLFIVVAWMVTLVVFFYAEEDWRGARAWNKHRQELEAGGAQLDLAAFIPKPIPDEQNFAATPVVKSWFVEANKRAVTNTTERFANNWQDSYAQISEKILSPKEKDSRQFMDLAAWGRAFEAGRSGRTNSNQEYDSGKLDLEARRTAVPAVLEGLKTNEAVLAELRDASQRPLSQYPIFYDLENPWGIYLPHLINVRNACSRLQLRACAELAAGRNDEALADVKLMCYLADSVKDEPFLISYLVRITCVQLAIQPVWEGLAGHAWSEAQLQELEARFQQYNFVADMKRPFDGERAVGVMTPDLIRKKGLGLLVELMGPGQPTSMDRKIANWWGGIIPGGWFKQEQVNYCELYQMQMEGAFNPEQRRISPARIEANTQKLQRELNPGIFGRAASSFLHHHVLASLLLPAYDHIFLNAARAQTAANQAALACALERFRLANGKFPDKLEALAPQFISQLPGDPLSGEAYKYRRADDGQFVLYSIGWNEKDDGGVPGKTLFDEKQGDWVWQYPAK